MDGIEVKLLMSFMTKSKLICNRSKRRCYRNRNKRSYGLNNWEKYLCS